MSESGGDAVRNELGSVYLIRNRAQRRVKIGFTSLDVAERVANLQTGSASRLELVMEVAGVPRSLEGELHQEFKRLRVLGEWFEEATAIEGRFRELRASNHERHVDEALQTACEAIALTTGVASTSAISKAQLVERVRLALDLSTCGCVWSAHLTPGGPVAKFWSVMRTRFVWDLVPFGFAYDLYRAWFAATVHSGSPLGKHRFIRELLGVVDGDEDWSCANRQAPVRTGSRMTRPEPLVDRYGLTRWRRDRAQNYRGLLRYPPAASA